MSVNESDQEAHGLRLVFVLSGLTVVSELIDAVSCLGARARRGSGGVPQISTARPT